MLIPTRARIPAQWRRQWQSGARDSYTRSHPGPDDVFLLVEVADSSLDFDHAEKLPIYGKAGIAEVWIVNLQDRQLELYRDPHFTGYSTTIILRESDHAAPASFPDAQISVGELLAIQD